MTKEKSIHDVLHDMQTTLKAPKNQFNKFGNYKYRSCEDILEGVKGVLPKGAYVTLSDEIVDISGRIYVKATATLAYNGDVIQVPSYAREPVSKKGMDESQVTGASSSYARKYALNGLFCIDDTKDADTSESKEQEKAAAPKQQKINHDELFDRIKKQVNEAATLDVLQYVWSGFTTELNQIKSASADKFLELVKIKDDKKITLDRINE